MGAKERIVKRAILPQEISGLPMPPDGADYPAPPALPRHIERRYNATDTKSLNTTVESAQLLPSEENKFVSPNAMTSLWDSDTNVDNPYADGIFTKVVDGINYFAYAPHSSSSSPPSSANP